MSDLHYDYISVSSNYKDKKVHIHHVHLKYAVMVVWCFHILLSH